MDPEKKMEEGDHEAVDADVKKHQINWPLLIVNSILMACGTIGGPLVLRLYYLHGGRRKWLTSCLQTAGFPVLIIPLSILFLRDRARGVSSIAEPRLMVWSGGIGLLAGIVNFMYSYGLSYLPVSTSSLLFSTQLGFTAFFAFILVKQRFTPYSINAIVLMTMGSVLLGLRQSGDRPPNVSRGEYLLGFFIMFGAASVLGFILPCTELAYSQVKKAINFTVVLQFQIGLSFAATVFSTIGMLVNGDFSAMGREAKAFDLGETKYYLLVTMSPLVFQMTFVGALGVIFSASSLFAGVLGAAILPLTEIAGVIIYHEKFTGEKGMALALCLWGFSSYFYGAFKNQKKQERKEKQFK